MLIKERLDLSPELREIDQQIEDAELALRATIISTLEGNMTLLPSHVMKKTEERIERASRKNAALDLEHFQTMEGRLEFCDFRELQDTIVSKQLWTKFEPRFKSKGTLSIKFDQLAELRNSIRHSRGVSQMAQKEGEAAIIWFQQVLVK